jgi:hypothetical protein
LSYRIGALKIGYRLARLPGVPEETLSAMQPSNSGSQISRALMDGAS